MAQTRDPRTPPRPPSSVRGAPRPWLIALFFFLLAIPLYANTLGNDYAVDDALFITDNAYTKSGIRGIPDIFAHDSFQGFFLEQKSLVSGGRYRPLSIATFALEYQVAGSDPALGHLINLLLYGLSGALLYLLLVRFFQPDARARWWTAPPFLITLLFMAHPIHTEVVANVKGRDEIMALIFGLSAFHAFLSFGERPGARGIPHLVAGGLFILLGLLSKETLIPFLVIIPLGIWFFRSVDSRRLGTVFGALVVPFAIYFVIRGAFAGPMRIVRTSDLLNDPFALASLPERVATIFKTLGIYLRLFFFPHPLSSDYYYNQVPLTQFGDPSSFFPAVLTVGLAVFAVAGIRGKNPIAFGLLFFAISFSIVSNLFFSIGTTLAERFLYIPSLGLAISVVIALRALSEKLMGKEGPRVAAVLLILVSAGFSAKTVLRNAAWKDNYTLFSTDVKVSPHSAKIQAALGSTLEEMAGKEKDPAAHRRLLDGAEWHFKRAVAIYPGHSLAWFGLGNLLIKRGKDRAAEAMECYRQVVTFEPDKALAYRNLALAADQTGDHETALQSIRHYRSLKPDDTEAALLEAGYLEKTGRVDDAIKVYEGFLRAQPRNAQAWGETGLFFARSVHDYTRAIEYLERAISIDSSKVAFYENLGSTQLLSKQPRAAVQTLEHGVARFGDTYLLQWNLAVAWDRLGDRAKSERYLARAEQLSGTR